MKSTRTMAVWLVILILLVSTQPPAVVVAKVSAAPTSAPLQANGDITCSNLTSKPATIADSTAEKPQAKTWYNGGSWWAVFPTTAAGASSAGTWLWKLSGTAWTEVLQLSSSTSVKADVKSSGIQVFVLLYDGSSAILSVNQYSGGTYTSQYTSPSLTLTGSETAAIDVDSQGRVWLATKRQSAAWEIVAYYIDPLFSTWNGPITLANTINSDDIAAIKALPNGTLGVLWSNQATQRFGFRLHTDGTDPNTWAADEVPASASAQNIGLGMADDHLSMAVAADSTLYAAVKTSYDTGGYPKIALLIRRPTGIWDPLYEVDQAGTRAIIQLNEINDIITIFYTSAEGLNDIVFKQSPTSAISFGSRTTIRTGGYNNVSGTKQNYANQDVILYANNSEVAGSLCTTTSTPAAGVCEADPSLVGCWQMNDNALDGSAFSNNATLLGNPSYGAGHSGNALLLNGSSQYGSVANNASLDLTGPMTISAWVKPGKDGTQDLVKKAVNGTTNGYEFSLSVSTSTTSPQTGFLRLNQVASAETYRIDSITKYPIDGTWIHLAATYDGTTLNYYYNGVLETTKAGPASIASNTLSLGFGAQLDASNVASRFFQGALDDVRIYNRALSLAEVRGLAGLSGTNTAPVANNQSVTTRVNTAKAITLTATDAESDPLTYSVVAAPTHGALTGTAPNLTYTPTTNYTGADSFTFKANDGTTDSNIATISITVQMNAAPVASDQSVSTAKNTAKAITLSATDADGDPLTYTVIDAPRHGALSGTAPSLTYTPTAGYSGPDNFTFKANDGLADSNVATVSINVTPTVGLGYCGSDASLVGCWSMDEGSGTTVADGGASPANNGTLTGSPTFTTGKVGSYALSLNGSTQYGTTPDENSLDITSQITLAAWIRTKVTTNTTQYIIKKLNGTTGNAGYELSLSSAGKVFARFFSPTSIAYRLDSVTNYPLTSTWIHVAVTYDGATIKIYYNGAVDNSSSQTFTIGANNLALGIGAQSDGGTKFNGDIDDARVYNRALNDTEIQALANPVTANSQSVVTNPNTPKAVTLSATGTGTLAYSVVDNPRHGSLSGTAPNLTYTPAADYTGPDSFTFKANDGFRDSNVATVSINVTWFGLSFDGSNDYVTFGNPLDGLGQPLLGAQNFTVETWFKRTGAGVENTTGTGGISLVPLVAKGAPQADGTSVDENYVLGISNNVLAADFETYAVCGSRPAGDNNPITGVTTISDNTWYHAAFTYDGAYLRLFLNGNLEREIANTCIPRYDNSQPAALGTMLTTTTAPITRGFFAGVLDEVRIWNRARSEAEIQASINQQITTAETNLVARWGLNEGSGTTASSSVGSLPGTLTGGPTWVAPGAPFNIVFTPVIITSGTLSAFASTPGTPSAEQSYSVAGRFLTGNLVITPPADFELSLTSGGPFTTSPLTLTPVLGTVPTTTIYVRFNRADAGTSSGNITHTSTGATSKTIPVNGTAALKMLLTVNVTGSGSVTLNPAGGLYDPGTLVQLTAVPGSGSSFFGWSGHLYGTSLTGTLTMDSNKSVNAHFVPVTTFTFQESVAGYIGTLDTTIKAGTPTTSYGANAVLEWDQLESGSGSPEYGLIQFTNIFGNNPGQIPLGSTILSATLQYRVGNVGNSASVYESLVAWDETTVFNTYGGTTGVQAEDYNPTVIATAPGTAAQTYSINVTASLQHWSDGTANRGWLFIPDGEDGVEINSSEAADNHPLLTVTLASNLGTPDAPSLTLPANGATGVSTSPSLTATVSDPNSDPLDVYFYARPKAAIAPDFSIIVLPDSQNYSATYTTIFPNMTQWIVDNRVARNISYVAHLGDIVNDSSVSTQWTVASNAMAILESPSGTGLPEGIPYGVVPGNHDELLGVTTNYVANFGVNRFCTSYPTGCRAYYGGSQAGDNQSSFTLFSGGGMDFIVLNLDYTSPDAGLLTWADARLKEYPNRRGIVVSHSIVSSGGGFSTWGQSVYDALKGNSNLFLTLSGHDPGEAIKTDTYNGNVVTSLLSDYQSYANGGNGYLRILRFSPANNRVYVQTYSTTLGTYETDTNSQFDFAYPMSSSSAFELVGSAKSVASGASAVASWAGRSTLTEYEWFAVATDGTTTATSPVWSFTTGSTTAVSLSEFTAQRQGAGIQLSWQTAEEVDLLSFNLYREEGSTGERALVASFSAAAADPYLGALYNHLDPEGAARRLTYWLEMRNLSGGLQWMALDVRGVKSGYPRVLYR